MREKIKPLNYIDLFAGAGGLSEGFIRNDFKPVAHVEYDKAACYTLRTRAAYHYLIGLDKEKLYYSYLRGEISREEFYNNIPVEILDTVINGKIGEDNKQIFSKIDEKLNGEEVDVVIGGPPCQAYSVVGRAPLKHKKDDERTKLYIHYGRFLKKYSPKLFVFENVPGMLSAAQGLYFKNLQKYYRRLGYEIKAKLLNASDFGVIQNRKRVVIIGWKKDLNLDYPPFTASHDKFCRDDIFLDLPAIKPGEKRRVQNYISVDINEYLKKTNIRNGVEYITQHITRPHNEKDLKIYKLAIKKYNQGEKIRNDQIPESIRTQKNIADFLDRFKVVGAQPHTMIAHIAKDGHHFIHPDKKQLRSISVREAARIQSFPDSYYFEGIKENQPRTAAFRQIGNAVPPVMAKEIALKIRELLCPMK